MRYPEGVNVVQSSGQLVGNPLSPLLVDLEFPLLQIREKVPSLQVLHHDIDVILVFKDIV